MSGLCRSGESRDQHFLLLGQLAPVQPHPLELLESLGGEIALAAAQAADYGHVTHEEARAAFADGLSKASDLRTVLAADITLHPAPRWVDPRRP